MATFNVPHRFVRDTWDLVSGHSHRIRSTSRGRVALLGPEIASRSDAINNDIVVMRDALAAMGLPADIFSFTKEHRVLDGTPIHAFSPRIAGYDVLFHHYWDRNERLLRISRLAKRVVLRYHNITPGHFFRPYAPDMAQAFDEARAMLAKYVSLPNLWALADSEFNQSELVELGLRPDRVKVAPPFHCIEDLLQLRPLEPVPLSFDLLTVGRIAPNKALHLMLECFAGIRAKVKAKLHIVGRLDPRLASYQRELDDIIARHGMAEDVTFHGTVDQRQLATLYHRCAVVWTCSQHEGFCVPVVEAMAFGKPIVATPLTALPETCGNAAAFANSKNEIVEAVCRLLGDHRQARELGEAGRKRYEQSFAPAKLSEAFSKAVRSLISQSLAERGAPGDQ